MHKGRPRPPALLRTGYIPNWTWVPSRLIKKKKRKKNRSYPKTRASSRVSLPLLYLSRPLLRLPCRILFSHLHSLSPLDKPLEASPHAHSFPRCDDTYCLDSTFITHLHSAFFSSSVPAPAACGSPNWALQTPGLHAAVGANALRHLSIILLDDEHNPQVICHIRASNAYPPTVLPYSPYLTSPSSSRHLKAHAVMESSFTDVEKVCLCSFASPPPLPPKISGFSPPRPYSLLPAVAHHSMRQRFVLAEMIKASHMDVRTLVNFIKSHDIRPDWFAMQLPGGKTSRTDLLLKPRLPIL